MNTQNKTSKNRVNKKNSQHVSTYTAFARATKLQYQNYNAENLEHKEQNYSKNMILHED